MESIIVYWGYIRMMEIKVETPLLLLLVGCCLGGLGGSSRFVSPRWCYRGLGRGLSYSSRGLGFRVEHIPPIMEKHMENHMGTGVTHVVTRTVTIFVGSRLRVEL